MLGQGTLPSEEGILTDQFPAIDWAGRIPQLLDPPLLYVPLKKTPRVTSTISFPQHNVTIIRHHGWLCAGH